MLTRRSLTISALGLGFLSTTTQVIILRELLVTFTGNELTLATTLAIWLLSIAAGCFTFRRAAGTGRPVTAGYLFIVAAPVAMAQACLTRVLDALAGSAGEILSPLAVVGLSAAGIVPGALVLGGLFVVLVGLAGRGKATRAIPLVYGYEAIGSAAAGAVLSLYLLQAVDSFACLAIGGLVGLACGGYLVLRAKPPAGRWGRIALAVSVAAVLGAGVFSRQIDLSTRRIQWSPLRVIVSTESRYGNILVTGRNGTYDFFETGNLSYTIPDPLYAEESAHIPLLYHPAPERVLVIGGAGSGIIGEVVKHRTVTAIDFVELDSEIIRLTGEFAPPGWLGGAAGIAVNPIYGDGRRYVGTADRKYDVVIVSIGLPVTLQTARYYTVEFYAQVARVLKPGGILGFKVPSGGAHVGPELGALVASLKQTCEQIFPQVVLLPGDYIQFVASLDLPIASRTDSLPRLLVDRHIQTAFVNRYRLFERLNPLERAYLDSTITTYDTGAVNSDAKPVSSTYAIARWAKHFGSGRLLSLLVRNLTVAVCVIGLLISAAIVVPLLMRAAGSSWEALSGSLALYAMGLTTMFTQVLIIMGFQIVSGYVYGWIAALIASFMLGMGLASSAGASRESVRRHSHLLALMLGLAALPLATTALLKYAGTAGASIPAPLPEVSFILLSFAAGGLGGAVFAGASAFLTGDGRHIAGAGALAYSLDLLGATVGGFSTGFLIIPSLGIAGSAYAVTAFNGILLGFIAVRRAGRIRREAA